MQWPIVLIAREDFNQRTSAELETRMTHIEEKSPEKSKQLRPTSKMSRIRNPDWENDENLKADIHRRLSVVRLVFKKCLGQTQVFATLDENQSGHAFYLSARMCRGRLRKTNLVGCLSSFYVIICLP